MTQASDLPKWRLVLALAALFLSSMCTMGDLVISPVAAGKKSTSTSIVAAADGLAVSACSYLVTGGMALTGAGCASVYPYLGAAMLAITAMSAGYWAVRKRRG